jgi:hypothetical protein
VVVGLGDRPMRTRPHPDTGRRGRAEPLTGSGSLLMLDAPGLRDSERGTFYRSDVRLHRQGSLCSRRDLPAAGDGCWSGHAFRVEPIQPATQRLSADPRVARHRRDTLVGWCRRQACEHLPGDGPCARHGDACVDRRGDCRDRRREGASYCEDYEDQRDPSHCGQLNPSGPVECHPLVVMLVTRYGAS